MVGKIKRIAFASECSIAEKFNREDNSVREMEASHYQGGQIGIDLPGGQINDPSAGKPFSLPFLLTTPKSCS